MSTPSKLIVEAARMLQAIDDAGCKADFVEELQAVERAWKREEHPRDRDNRYRSAHFRDLADILADLFCCDQSEGIDALKVANSDLLPALKINELFRYAAALKQVKGAA